MECRGLFLLPCILLLVEPSHSFQTDYEGSDIKPEYHSLDPSPVSNRARSSYDTSGYLPKRLEALPSKAAVPWWGALIVMALLATLLVSCAFIRAFFKKFSSVSSSSDSKAETATNHENPAFQFEWLTLEEEDEADRSVPASDNFENFMDFQAAPGSSFGADLSLKQETNVGGASELPMTEYISKMLSNYQSQDIDGGVDNFNFEDDDESFAHKNLRVEWCRKISESPSSKEEPGSWMTVVQKDLGSGFTFVAPQDGSEPIFLPTNQLRFYQAGS